ncbi:hypothetical protein TRVL_04022 [Trypanosoma vivax]|nr:hypothetical protein TRVL_04022 [Trypanosoma vivax]
MPNDARTWNALQAGKTEERRHNQGQVRDRGLFVMKETVEGEERAAGGSRGGELLHRLRAPDTRKGGHTRARRRDSRGATAHRCGAAPRQDKSNCVILFLTKQNSGSAVYRGRAFEDGKKEKVREAWLHRTDRRRERIARRCAGGRDRGCGLTRRRAGGGWRAEVRSCWPQVGGCGPFAFGDECA